MPARTHGLSNSKTFNSWRGMIERCTSPANKKFHHYGGRGITVCDRWRTFQNFLDDMGERPAGMELDRIDSHGDYCPANCRWISHKANTNNRTNNRVYTHNGQTKTLSQWGESSGLGVGRLYQRVHTMKWPFEKAITTPALQVGRVRHRRIDTAATASSRLP